MSRPRDNEQLRDVFITTRWTKDETATIDKALRPGETRSQYLRRLVERDTQTNHTVDTVDVVDDSGRVILTVPLTGPMHADDLLIHEKGPSHFV